MGLEKMIAVVQCYIHVRKNKEVNISINGLGDVFKLQKAYSIALDWFDKNNVSISNI